MNRPTPIAGPAAALTPQQRETLRILLDTIVPPAPDRRLPGAGELPELLRDIAAAVPKLREFLAALDGEAVARCGAAFAALDEARRAALLDDLRARDAALRQLALETVTSYYQQDRVLEALGLEARPPFPKGYPVDAGDLSLLNPVIARGRIDRDAP